MKRSNIKHFATLGAILIALVLIASTVVPSFIGISFGQVAEAASQIDSYYSSLDTSKTGSAFRADLYELIKSTHKKETTYAGLKEVYKVADADPNKSGNIIWFYTGTSVSFSGFGSGGGTTNREHVWPKNGGNAFPETTEAGSDGHHLRPCEANLNSTRGSKSFDIVPQTTGNIVKQNGSSSYENLCYTSGDFFYPGEGYRGATARILFYVQTRWGNDYDLTFVDSAGNNKTIGKISTLLQWHLQEPPTAEEIRRNEAVFGIQGNRNPFIDHPEYATQIYCYDGQSYNSKLQQVAKQYGDYQDTDVESISLSPSSLNLAIGQSMQISAAVSPSGASKAIEWTSSNKSVATVDENGKVTALSSGYTTIIATSVKTPTVKATIDVLVKSVTNINISGTPSKTSYYEGDTFNPDGLTVTATYSDGSSGVLDNASCTWLDAGTKLPALSKGTTAVICKVGDIEKTLNGIVVNKTVGKTESFNRSSFTTTTSAYGWNAWSSGTISGQAFMYPGAKDKIQMNSSKSAYYIFNTTPIPGQLVSITVKMQGDAKDWDIRTSTTPYDTTASGYPKTGTSHGIQSATSEGTTWTLNTSDPYFTINYLGSGVAYLDSITISYGGSGGDECQHTYTSVITPPTCTEKGFTTYTCSKCEHSYIDSYVDALGHSYGEWTVKTPATCTTEGLKERDCQREGCNHKETQIIPTLGHSYQESDWIDEVPATCTAEGTKGHYHCDTCNKDFDKNGTELTSLTIGKKDHVLEWKRSNTEHWQECANCDYATSHAAHNIQSTADKKPTCTEPGHTAGERCADCGYSTNSTDIPALGHNYTTSVTAPTCMEKGYTTHTCTRCGDSYIDAYVDAHEHNFGEWHSISATQEERVCSACGHSEVRNIEISNPDVAKFISEVNAINSASSLTDRFNAIKTALTTYKSLDEDARALVAEQYATLCAHVQTYNAQVANINSAHSNASQFSVLLLSGSISAFAAILYLFRRTML